MKNYNFTLIKKLMLLAFVLGLVTNVSAYTGSGGAGTEADPYLISTADDFNALRTENGLTYFKLTNDIDMSGFDASTEAKTFYPIIKGTAPFCGRINGAGHVVKNLTVTPQPDNVMSTNNNYKAVGVFGVYGFGSAANYGTIDSLGFENITIDVDKVTYPAALYVGIIGRTVNNGVQISSCYVKNSIITGGNNATGGFVGFIGANSPTMIIDCYVDATVTIGKSGGGIVGEDSKTTTVLNNCAFYGNIVEGSFRAAPIVGVANSSSSYTVCYYEGNDDVYNWPPVVVGVEIAAANIKTESEYVGFDFTTPIWKMGNDYAILNYVTEGVVAPPVTSNIAYENTGSFDPNNPLTYTNASSVTLNTLVNDSVDRAFEGWYRDVALTAKVTGVAIASGTVGDTTFYAKWVTPETYNITYMNVDDVTNTNPATYTNVDEVTLVVPGDSAGYTWEGWFENSDFSTPISTPAIAVGGSSDVTFYGKWQAAPFSEGGDGSVGDPYLVSSVFDVQSMNLDGSAHYKFTADIDMDGQAYTPITTLSGSIDGDEHVISNLTINGRGFVVGLAATACTIKNLGFKDITAVSIAGGSAALVGFMWNGTEARLIENCYVQGGSITGTEGVAGLVGWAWTSNTTIKDCFVDATISGTKDVGGLTGRTQHSATSTFEDCAFYGLLNVTGVFDKGAIRGNIQEGVDNEVALGNTLYYTDTLTSTISQGAAVGVAVGSLTTEASFSELDFTTIWKMGNNYPVLSWVTEDLGTPTGPALLERLNVSVYPNPTTGIVNVVLAEQSNITIYNLNGAAVYQQAAMVGENVLDISVLESGLYLLTVNGETSSTTVKFQIK